MTVWATRRSRAAWTLLGLALAAAGQLEPSGSRLQRVDDGVYVAVVGDPLAQPTDSNSVVIVNDDDVIVVDANVSPSRARAVLDVLRTLTDRPVRYVINTHWHDDHVLGNQAYRERFPGVQFVTHPKTLEKMRSDLGPALEGYRQSLPAMVEKLELQIKAGRAKAPPLPDAELDRLTSFVATVRRAASEARETRIVLPDLLVDRELTIRRGGHTIEVRHLGGGHTEGDLIVRVVEQGIVVAGDLVMEPVPFALSSDLPAWTKTLDALMELRPRVLIPGHGPVQRDLKGLSNLRRLLAAVLLQVEAGVLRGQNLEETRFRVDIEAERALMIGPNPPPALRDSFDRLFLAPAIERTYAALKDRHKPSFSGAAPAKGRDLRLDGERK